MGDNEDHPLEVVQAWRVSDGEYDGRPMITRFNEGARGLAGLPQYRTQIGIAVPLRRPNQLGLPEVDEQADLDRLESRLETLLRGRAILVGVITTGGMREYVLYTDTSEWLAPLVEDLRRSQPEYEVQTMSQDDPDWSVFIQFVG